MNMKISKPDLARIVRSINNLGGRNAEAHPGIRYNMDDADKPMSVNIALVSDHEDWDDTDLHKHGDWDDVFSVPLSEDGRAIIDLYVYSNDSSSFRELETNLVCFFDKDGLERMEEVSNKNYWKRGAK